MSSHRLAALLLIGAIGVSPSALAFNYSFLQQSVLEKLTSEDIEIGSRATGVALDSGQSGHWSNPKTGATGVITILGTLDVDDHKGCRRAKLSVAAGGRSGSGTYVLCKAPSGRWKFYSTSQRQR